MKIRPSTLSAALFVVLFFARCNPDCSSLQNVQVSQGPFRVGDQMLITATPVNSLEGKRVTMNGDEIKGNNLKFVPDVGLLARVPIDISTGTTVNLKIEDPDCSEIFEMDFGVVDPGYFEAFSTFTPPIPADYIIPDFSGGIFPPSIDNAWLSPNNASYCLWFTSRKDIVTLPNGKKDTLDRPILDESQSFEQSTCGCDRAFATSGLPYANNHISGVVDKDKNYIHIFIDRTPIGGEVEELSGKFINVAATPFADNTGTINCLGCAEPPFAAKPPSLGFMMLLTSHKTGKQVVAYQLKL